MYLTIDFLDAVAIVTKNATYASAQYFHFDIFCRHSVTFRKCHAKYPKRGRRYFLNNEPGARLFIDKANGPPSLSAVIVRRFTDCLT